VVPADRMGYQNEGYEDNGRESDMYSESQNELMSPLDNVV